MRNLQSYIRWELIKDDVSACLHSITKSALFTKCSEITLKSEDTEFSDLQSLRKFWGRKQEVACTRKCLCHVDRVDWEYRTKKATSMHSFKYKATMRNSRRVTREKRCDERKWNIAHSICLLLFSSLVVKNNITYFSVVIEFTITIDWILIPSFVKQSSTEISLLKCIFAF